MNNKEAPKNPSLYMPMMRRKKKDLGFSLKEITDWFKKYIFPLAAVLILGVITYFIYIPFVQEIPGLYQQKKQLTKNIDALNENLALLKNFSDMPLDAMQTKMDTIIPRDVNVSQLVSEIESMGSAAGLKVLVPNEKEQTQRIERLVAREEEVEEVSESNVIPLPIRVQLRGDEMGIKKFLTSLRRGSRLFSITEAKIDIEEAGNWSADLQVSVYVSPVPMEYAPAEPQVVDVNSPKVYQAVRALNINVSEERYNKIISKFIQP